MQLLELCLVTEVGLAPRDLRELGGGVPQVWAEIREHPALLTLPWAPETADPKFQDTRGWGPGASWEEAAGRREVEA